MIQTYYCQNVLCRKEYPIYHPWLFYKHIRVCCESCLRAVTPVVDEATRKPPVEFRFTKQGVSQNLLTHRDTSIKHFIEKEKHFLALQKKIKKARKHNTLIDTLLNMGCSEQLALHVAKAVRLNYKELNTQIDKYFLGGGVDYGTKKQNVGCTV